MAASACSDAKEADKQNKKLLIAAKVRNIIVCLECHKPRCVYAAGTLGLNERNYVKLVVDSKMYSCGSALFPPNSPLHSTVICRQALTCNEPVKTQYYSSVCVTFPPVCWFCGSPEETLTDDELIQRMRSEYAVVRPICFLCRSDGKRPATWGASNVAKRTKH